MKITKKKQILAILLAMLLCSLSFVSCSEENTKKENVADVPTDETMDETESETVEVDPFAGIDFGGKEIRISSSIDKSDATNAHHLIAGSGEMNGESVNDAVYKRNMDVEDLLNVSLHFIPSEWNYNTGAPEIEKLVLSGDCGFEVVINDLIVFGTIAPRGYLHSVADNQIMDFTQSYWYGDAIHDLEIVEGCAYMMLGDLFTDSLASVHVLYYNKDIINDNYSSYNYIQDIVLEGSWTVDEMVRVSEETAVDLNGDGKMTCGDDLFGFTPRGFWGPMVPVLLGFDVEYLETTNDEIAYCFKNERSVKILEKLNELFWANSTNRDTGDLDWFSAYESQQTVFVGYLRLSDLSRMRDIEFQVGLAPYPKLDNIQEKYVSSLHDSSEVGAIVVTTPLSEMDFVSTVLEVMAREAGRTIIPVYYEEALKIKYANGVDDAAMIDLIHDSVSSPFAVTYNNVLSQIPLQHCFLLPMIANNNDFVSVYDSVETPGKKALDNLVNAFKELKAKEN